MEMVYCTRYIIHKYAETVEDICRLEEVVGLKKAVTCGSIIEDIKNEGRAEGRAEGRTEERNFLISKLKAKGMTDEQINALLS